MNTLLLNVMLKEKVSRPKLFQTSVYLCIFQIINNTTWGEGMASDVSKHYKLSGAFNLIVSAF